MREVPSAQMASAARTKVLLACRSKSTQFTVLVHGIHNPVATRVLANDTMCWVHQKDLKILVV